MPRRRTFSFAALGLGLTLAGAWGCPGKESTSVAVDASSDEAAPADGSLLGDASRPDLGACPLCTAPPHATATCDGTTCGFVCDEGYHRCGTGCVRDDDPSACGASCASCAPAGGTIEGYAVCDAGQCGMVCTPGWTYCGDPGACTNLAFDCKHCGTCAHRCGLYEVCSNGTCQPGTSVDPPCN